MDTETDEQVQLAKRIAHAKQYSNIKERYKEATITPITPNQEGYVNKLKANINKTRESKKLSDFRDMFIYGGVGTGKTHIACGLINKLTDAGVYAKYITQQEILDAYRKLDYSRTDRFKEAQLLVIDEIATGESRDWKQCAVTGITNFRYDEKLPTIFITNATESEFKAFMGDRAVDRMRDNGIIRVDMDGDSLRDKKHKEIKNV